MPCRDRDKIIDAEPARIASPAANSLTEQSVWDFSWDEVCFFVAAAVVAAVGLWNWYAPLLCVPLPRGPRRVRQRLALAAAPPLCLALLYPVLQTWADPVHVAGHLDYVLLFVAGGAAWMFVGAWCMPVLGISPRDDAVERGNPAAVAATVGAMLGVVLA